ncbi:hypothetical protein TNIN_159571 [Trichonephila inaurata madagascariensis]|uniref:Uncharacterized protein n=1 Tax=Trichonephila inaurata madagascariensis TaxID=2747483 RepID=A0A8X7BPM6_9ARAC|nr:hypothetical protein TNIN_159571 [Trichonephila inaurata madagascariensis]
MDSTPTQASIVPRIEDRGVIGFIHVWRAILLLALLLSFSPILELCLRAHDLRLSCTSITLKMNGKIEGYFMLTSSCMMIGRTAWGQWACCC